MSADQARPGLEVMRAVADRRRAERALTDAVALRAAGADWDAVSFALGKSRHAVVGKYGPADLLRLAADAGR
jgi:hypothetical protein